MAEVKNAKLSISQEGGTAKVTVTYDADISMLERYLMKFGLAFRENIALYGMDNGKPTLPALYAPGGRWLPVPEGSGAVTVPVERKFTVPREALQEDPAVGDADEILARIVIDPRGEPVQGNADTSVVNVLG